MPRADAFIGFLLESLTPVGPVSARRMFGGVGLYHGATMFGLVARGELYLKVGDRNRAEYEARGQGPFTYATKRGSHTIGSYWSCPPELLDDPPMLQDWVRKAVAAALDARAPRRAGTPRR